MPRWAPLLSGVQDGGAIAILGSNNRADLTLCTLSGNIVDDVRRHADAGVVQEASVHAWIGAVAWLLAHACERIVARGR